jgi:glucose/arabinose dehydrogenase
MPRRPGLLVASLALTALAACGSSNQEGPVSTITHTPGSVRAQSMDVALKEIGSFDQPVAIAIRNGDSNLYVAEKSGRVRRMGGNNDVVLDLHDIISTGSEQGLLGMAFSEDGKELYVDFTDTSGDTHVDSFAMEGDVAPFASRHTVLTVNQPYDNHNGGQILFGPDHHLYIALGDGGSAGDPQANGQSLRTRLGKILRVDPHANGDGFTVPSDNPFVDEHSALGEIWAYGLRNPWRFTFDSKNGDVWIGDVGQDHLEEIDVQPGSSKGQNYGWNRLEGSQLFKGSAPQGAVAPTYEYSHEKGRCSIAGGYVYRGKAIPELVGKYVFGDYCSGEIWALKNGKAELLPIQVDSLSSFGEDSTHELYALSQQGPVYQLTTK